MVGFAYQLLISVPGVFLDGGVEEDALLLVVALMTSPLGSGFCSSRGGS